MANPFFGLGAGLGVGAQDADFLATSGFASLAGRGGGAFAGTSLSGLIKRGGGAFA